MARRLHRVPFSVALRKAPQLEEEEIKSLDKCYVSVISEFLNEFTTNDDLHDMIKLCLEAWQLSHKNPADLARQKIFDDIKKKKFETAVLYSRRNISLNQCFGDNKTPAGEFLNLSAQDEWD